MAKPYNLASLGLAMAAVALGGCASRETTDTGATGDPALRPQVVATSSIICDLAQQIAEDSIDLACLMAPGQDPHTFQARPSDRQMVDGADLVLYDGYNFAPSVLSIVTASPNPAPKVAVLEMAVPNPLMGQGHDHDHDHGDDHGHGESEQGDHDHGDEHGHGESEQGDHDHGHDHEETSGDSAQGEAASLVPDPHIWHNARHNAAMVEVIATALSEVNPDLSSQYQAQADQLTTQFTTLDQWIQDQVSTVPEANRRLVTTHDAFRYFAEAYGFEIKGALSGLSTEAQPSPRALTALVDQIKAATVPAIFAESTTNPALIQTVANNAGVAVAEQPLMVEGPGGPDSVAPNTQAMLVVNTCTIVNALGGTCDEAKAPL